MEAGAESDEEVEDLREGFAVEDLRVSSFIVKVYGKTVGFTFMQSRLNALWCPIGRMDIIDLGRDFFLVWFGCEEDHDLVLEKGPWFLGDHFLSIRP